MSDQYTPTTKDFQQAWIAVQLGKPEATAEFARWLADVKAEAWQEGVAAQCAAYNMTPDAGPNPYRKGTP